MFTRAVQFGSLPVLSIGFLQLRADSAPNAAEDKVAVRLMKPRDFPIYDEPKSDEYQLIPEGSSAIRDAVSVARQQVWKFSDSFQGVATFTQNAYTTTEKNVKCVVQYIKTEEGFYPRAGVISIAGLAGLVLARRGGFIRKVFYSGGLMTATASLCYPYQAVRIGKAELAWAQAKATELYNNTTTKPTPAVEKVASTESSEEAKAEAANEGEASPAEAKSEPEKGDPGQSNPADKDMYTTRS